MDLWHKYDHILLTDMLDMQIQMRTPAEEREQEHNNREFKKLLQRVVDSDLVLQFGGIQKTYIEMVKEAQKPKPVEKKVIPPELQAKILSGVELTQEEIQQLQNGTTTSDNS